MQSTLIKQANDESVSRDYKQFIRDFEQYRHHHPELSFQQAWDLFFRNEQTDHD